MKALLVFAILSPALLSAQVTQISHGTNSPNIVGNTPAAPAVPDKPADPKAAPVIPDALKYKWAKAQLLLKQANDNLQAAKQEAMAVNVEITQTCGTLHDPQLDQKGDPLCVDKPKPVEPEKPASK